MTTKPTIGQLRRENERLKARLVELEEKLDMHMRIYRDRIYAVVDAETRIKQAIEVLTGEIE